MRVETWSMDLENLYLTPCFSRDDHLTVVEYLKPQKTESVCTTTEKETRFEDRGGGHTLKTDKKKSREKKITISCRAMINRAETGFHH